MHSQKSVSTNEFQPTPPPSLSLSPCPSASLRSPRRPCNARAQPQAPVMSQIPTLVVSPPPSTSPSLPPQAQMHTSSRSSSSSTVLSTSGRTTPPTTPPYQPQPAMRTHAPAPPSMSAVMLPPPSYSETVQGHHQQQEQGQSQPEEAAYAYYGHNTQHNSMRQHTRSSTIRVPPPIHPMSAARGVPDPHPIFMPPEPLCEQGRHTYVVKYGVSSISASQ